jgi:SAM-dependent methyltransferase
MKFHMSFFIDSLRSLNLRKILGDRIFLRSKLWSRVGIFDELKRILNHNSWIKSVLVVGGYGYDLNRINLDYPNLVIKTLDVDKSHDADFTVDISDQDLHELIREKFDLVIAIEVLEHVPEYKDAVKNIYSILADGGTFFASTPWLVPVHDSPFDYLRFSMYEISRMLDTAGFSEIRILCRGGVLDSFIALGFRTKFEKGFSVKVFSFFIYIISFVVPKPKTKLKLVGFTNGFIFSGIRKVN